MSHEQIIVAITGVGYAIVAFARAAMTGIVRGYFVITHQSRADTKQS